MGAFTKSSILVVTVVVFTFEFLSIKSQTAQGQSTSQRINHLHLQLRQFKVNRCSFLAIRLSYCTAINWGRDSILAKNVK